MKTISLLSLLILSVILANSTYSQGWVTQTSGTSSTLRQIVFYNAQTGWTVGDGGRILKSTNGGSSWSTQNSGTAQDLYSIVFQDSATLYACGNGGTILKTTNGGSSWTSQNSGSVNKLKSLYEYTVNNYYCCGENGTLLHTTNGISWIASNSNTTQHLNCIFFQDGTTGWTYGNNGTVRANGFGGPWAIVSFPTTENLYAASGFGTSGAFCTSAGNIYNTYANTYTANNTGVITPLNTISIINSKTWCAGDNAVIRYSPDNRQTWTGQNISSSANISSIFMLDSLRGWICGTNGLISGTITGGVIGIKPISTEIPENYNLSQNYPNPFNPSTNIHFAIPKSSFVRITVYDMLGRELETIVNERLNAGTYNADWNASNYPSGVYFYKLNSENYSETKKMMLIK